MALPNRKACDRCHSLKLACRRIDEGQCERCLKANRPCTSSPSLRHHKKRTCRGREPRNRGKPLQIRPAPQKATGETLLPPHRGRLPCNSMSQPEHAPATANPFNEPQVNKDVISLSSTRSSGPGFPKFLGEEAYRSYNTCPPGFLNCEDFQQTPFAAEVGPRYPELRLSHSSLNYNQFHDTMFPEYFKETIMEYLTEVNRAHDAWKTLQTDTTCSGTSTVHWGFDETYPPRLSIEEVFHLSQRFAFSLNTMLNSSTLAIHQVDPTVASLVYSRLQDIHDIIIQLATQSLQLSKDAVVRISNWHRLYT
ncbi:hypothetical protein CHU98_g1761 [Xylaria longipes]|nr:hypothetical protein CHU98_g1761 [Xylaria longipes]